MVRINKRRCLLVGAIAILSVFVTAVFVGYANIPSTDPGFRKVRVGMTVAEVERIVGRRWTSGIRGGYYLETLRYEPEDRLFPARNEWLEVGIKADSSGHARVAAVEIIDLGPDPRTLWERIQDEYHYQKSKLGW